MKTSAAMYAQRQLDLAESNYSAEDKEAITRFLTFLQARGTGERRLSKYVGHFMRLRELTAKPLTALEGSDIDSLVAGFNRSGWSAWTKHDYQFALKAFYRFIDGNENRAGRIKVLKPADKQIDEGEVLTDEDVSLMEAASRNIQNKAAIRLLYESAAAQQEFLTMRIKDASLQPPFLVFHLRGTKNAYRDRKVPINNPHALELFQDYLAAHPRRNVPEAELWVSMTGEPLRGRNLTKILLRTISKAGIDKRCNPHWFRHSKITAMARMGLPEQLIKDYVGWSKSSDMMAVYSHTGINALMDGLLKLQPETLDAREERASSEIAELIADSPSLLLAIVEEMKKKGKLNLLADLQKGALRQNVPSHRRAKTKMSQIPLSRAPAGKVGNMALGLDAAKSKKTGQKN